MIITLERAIAIAALAHEGERDRKTGEPYIFHVMRVTMSMTNDKERIVAALLDHKWLELILEGSKYCGLCSCISFCY